MVDADVLRRRLDALIVPLVVVPLTSSALVACQFNLELPGEGDLPNDVQFESEHFVFRARSTDEAPCAGIVDTMERHFQATRATLGFPWPDGRVVNYYKYEDLEDLARSGRCPKNTHACYNRKTQSIHTSSALEEHELIHAYLAPLGNPPTLIEEGVAELLSCGTATGNTPPISWDEEDGGAVYTAGRWLVAHLLREFGTKRFRDFYEAPWTTRSAEEMESRFIDAFGVSVDDAWEAARIAEPEDTCGFHWACGEEALAPGSQVQFHETCDQSDAFRTLEVAKRGLAELRIFGSPVRVGRCGEVNSDDDVGQLFATAESHDPGRILLAEGTYFVAPAASPSPRQVEGLRPSVRLTTLGSEYVGEDCEKLEAFEPELPLQWTAYERPLPHELETPLHLKIALPDTPRTTYLALATPTAVELRSRSETNPLGASVKLCASCDPATCSPEGDGTLTGMTFVLSFPQATRTPMSIELELWPVEQ